MQNSEDTAIDSRSGPKGVHGWLMFFVIFSGIFTPALFLYKFFMSLNLLSAIINSEIKIILLVYLLFAIEAAAILQSVYASYSIVKLKQDALMQVRRLFWFWGCLSIAQIFYQGFFIGTGALNVAIDFLAAIIWISIWVFYFQFSKRVRNTIGSFAV